MKKPYFPRYQQEQNADKKFLKKIKSDETKTAIPEVLFMRGEKIAGDIVRKIDV